jgi:hypothetical protein
MKFYIIALGLMLFVSGQVRSQSVDSLYLSDPRKVADTVFGQLDPTFYKGRLLNRSMSSSQVASQQLEGNYNQIHDLISWGSLYDDIALSYVDTNEVKTIPEIGNEILDFFGDAENESDDLLRQPFGLILQDVSYIDTSKINSTNFDGINFQYVPKVEESSLYSNVLLKSAAIIEFYPDNGYTEGKLVYDERFISTSENIEIERISISVNRGGFQVFDAQTPEIDYIRYDSVKAQSAIEYKIDGITKYDTIEFYLTTNTGNDKDAFSKDIDKWDDRFTWEGDYMKFRYGVRYGCGNNEKIKRPIIILPPYRPRIQAVGLNKYYNQFNFKSLFSTLNDMGYDVIFIKEKPGNNAIWMAGSDLARFIDKINFEKELNYPNQYYETILMGLSAGGQHARYALMKMEKEHMETGRKHHHTRLYVPFDSPHWGGNVPMFTQAVYENHSHTFFGFFTWGALTDDASRDMLMNHIIGSNINISNNNQVVDISPAPTSDRINLDWDLKNEFLHQFSHENDLRRSFPTFTRNIAISTGRNDQDYEDEYSLTPGMMLFKQQFVVPSLFSGEYRHRRLHASKSGITSSVFFKHDINQPNLLFPIVDKINYRTTGSSTYEWDMAQGGHKNEFYDGYGISALNLIPIGAVPLLRHYGSFYLGTKHYERNMSFLPLVSALGINPSIWENNNLFYNVMDEGLMLNQFNSIVQSDQYGYPHLDHPNNHFNITPFEAVYADPQTYEHIKMQESIEDDNLDDVFLVHLRNFIIDEVEADVVCLQNQVIGENHAQWLDPFRYKAWYDAKSEIRIGHKVTPKTDPGDYIIQNTGGIRVMAGDSIVIESGFHTQAGSTFHALIGFDGCDRPRSKAASGNNNYSEEGNQINRNTKAFNNRLELEEVVMIAYPNPNNGNFTVEIQSPNLGGHLYVYNTTGRMLYKQKITQSKAIIKTALEKGVYLLRWVNGKEQKTTKIVVQ